MIMTQERMILKGQAHFDEMVSFVRKSAKDGRPIDQVERSLWQSLLSLGHSLLSSYVEGVGPGDIGDTLVHEGRELRRLESPHDRRYVSVFGELTISRYVYGSRETQKHEVVPTDALLGLPDSEFSYVLQEWDQSFCVEDSYEESRRKVFDAREVYPLESSMVLAKFQQLDDIEDRARSASVEERLALRQSEAVPVWQSLGEWLESKPAANVLPKSKLGEALGYLRNQWEALQTYQPQWSQSIRGRRKVEAEAQCTLAGPALCAEREHKPPSWQLLPMLWAARSDDMFSAPHFRVVLALSP